MKQVMFNKAMRTMFLTFAILSVQLADKSMGAMIILLIASGLGYIGFDDLVKRFEHETIFSNELYEGTGND